MKDLIIIGAGGNGKVVADIAQKLGVYNNIAFLDDGDVKSVMGLSVVGKTTDIVKYIKTADIFVSIGDNKTREGFIKELLLFGASIPSLIHPSASIGCGAEIGVGTAIMAGAVVSPCARIGKGVIVNTCASVDHDSVIADFVHVSVGARIAGTVKVGERTLIGVGAVVINNISIVKDCVIGAGAVVVKDIEDSGVYVGVPAHKK